MNSPFPHPDDIAKIHQAMVDAAGEGGTPDFSAFSIATHAATMYGNLPHPQVPSIKIKDYLSFERVAWMLNDKQPKAVDVAHAAETLTQAGLSPAQFETVWSIARPVANRLLGQDPTMQQLIHLQAASPGEIHDYYMGHPYPGYEEVTAGQMVKAYRAAEPIARQYGQTPNHEEASRFALTGSDVDVMHAHYSERA